MEDIDLEQIKASLVEEQQLETKLKKQPEVSDNLLPLLHSLYIARMNLERANWGCSVDRNRFSLLKSSLLEEAHLEELLKQEGNNGSHEEYNLDGITPISPKPEGSLDTDLQKLLNIAKNKSSIYKSDLEANLDLTVACPLLPTGETPKTIATGVTQKTRDYLNKKKANENTLPLKAAEVTQEPKKVSTKQDTLKEKEKRRQLVRYIMSSTR